MTLGRGESKSWEIGEGGGHTTPISCSKMARCCSKYDRSCPPPAVPEDDGNGFWDVDIVIVAVLNRISAFSGVVSCGGYGVLSIYSMSMSISDLAASSCAVVEGKVADALSVFFAKTRQESRDVQTPDHVWLLGRLGVWRLRLFH